MTYKELEKVLQEWTEKVLKTKANTNDYTKGWVDKDRMISDITTIIEEGFI